MCLGTANDAYKKFVDELGSHGIQVEWRYYKDGKAWLGKAIYRWTTARGTPKETTAFWLSIWDGFFKVGLLIPEKARMEALNLTLSNNTKMMIENAEQIGKIKLFSLGFELFSDELFDDIFVLIDFRKMLK